MRRLAAALTDLAYLLFAALPVARAAARRWTRRRYRALAPSYDRGARSDPDYLAPLTRMLAALEAEPQVIVEPAAGTGIATRALMGRYPRSLIIAVDLSPAMLSWPGAASASRLRRIVGDVYALPLQSCSADLVVTHNAPFCVREMGRILRGDGVAAVVLSRAGWLPRRLALWSLSRSAGGRMSLAAEYRDGAGRAWLFRAVRARG